MEPRKSNAAHSRNQNTWSRRLLVRLAACLMLAGLMAGVFLVGSTASSLDQGQRVAPNQSARATSRFGSPAAISAMFRALPEPPVAESIATFEVVSGVCTANPKDSFDLGETVCAKITGASLGTVDRAANRIGWVSPYGSLAQGADITTDPQTGLYVIPSAATQTFTDTGGAIVTVDNRGTWSVGIYSASDGSQRETARFTVHDPAKAFVDISVNQSVNISGFEVGAGSGGVFDIFVTNNGPDDAQSVVLSDTLSDNATFSAISDDGFTCGTPVGTLFSCTLATMPAGTAKHLTLSYMVNGDTPTGAIITNTVSVSSSDTPCSSSPAAPCELTPNDNSVTATAEVPAVAAGQTCTLNCHDNFSVVADAFQEPGHVHGALVSFGAASVNGSCGAIDATFDGIPMTDPPTDPPTHIPASGAFYPVGTTVIHVTSETGGGSCSFTITVVEGTPPTISCPPDKTATATTVGGSHTFTAPEIGSPTSNPAGLIVTFERSDNVPATYDANGDVVTPEVVHSLTDPFPSGTTGITWTVTDSNGLSASCTQRITVHDPCASDAEPPTITAPPAVTVNTGPNSTTCGVALSPSDDGLGTPVVHDDCSATLTVTGIPPGNLFPVGATTVTYTATDGGGRTASATQLVTVVDNTVPVIVAPANASYVCPSEVPAGNPSQAHGNNPGLPNGGPVFDNCGISSVTVSDSSTGAGSAASPKIITRTYTATDIHGNSASAVQVITVIDAVPPVFTFVPPAVTAYTGPGATTCDTVVPNATLGTATATDNCSVTVTRSPSGNTFGVGTTTITWTATDGAGNTATATQNVTVIDNTVPVITVNGTTPSMWPPNHKYQTFQLTGFVTGASDNCGGVGISNVVIEKVTSDEIENGNGDGNTTNDIIIAANCKSVQLRSEREGDGNGRVYTITFKVTDTHGNVGRATSKVVVAHNPGETAVDSGVHYTVTGSCP